MARKRVEPPKPSANENVCQVVKVLMAINDLNGIELATLMGAGFEVTQNLYSRLNGKVPWSADDVARLAEVFHRPAGFFYEPLDLTTGSSLSKSMRQYAYSADDAA
jgi:hypothetical protein